jgi:hypothetical protein
MVEQGKGIKPIWTFTRPRDQASTGDVHTVCCGKGVKQMFWAAFGEEVQTGLVPLHGDPEAACGGVSGWVICELYHAFLPDFIQPGDIFMHDNAPVHQAGIVKNLLAELGIEVMKWPPYSPDLNPIENL